MGEYPANLLSRRGEIARDWEDFLFKYMNICLSDPYDKEKNPMGYINLGTSVNNMCSEMIYPKITSGNVWFCDRNLLHYRESYGIMRLREAFSKVLTEFFEPSEPVLPENVFCLNGVTSCIDVLAHCLADPGDVFLTPTPMYGRIYTDFKQKSLIDVWPIPIIEEDDTEDNPVLTFEKVNKAYLKAVEKKKVVRGVFLIHPSNPLGEIYSPKLLMEILIFCHKHSLHVIVDEVYALSVFSESPKFNSILSFSTIPDPERTHVLYGLSKDFGLAGLRIGIVHTKCEPLQKCLIQLTNFHTIPFPVMDITARYLENLEWLKGFVVENQKRLTEKFNYCVKYLEKFGLKVKHSSAGFFLWVDFRDVCKSFEQEMDLFEYLIEKAHLYVGPGKEFFCTQPGWFRIVFTENPNHLHAGLERLVNAINDFKELKK